MHFAPQRGAFFKKEADLQPHLSRYWLTPGPSDNPQQFALEVHTVCDLYKDAPKLHGQGAHVVSIDEKTGIQALEHAHPLLPMQPGKVERREFEYIRHGTQTLTANFEVATGKILEPTVAATRTEDDFAAHIGRLIATDPNGTWIFVTDQLNTHKSESLVRLVEQLCQTGAALGIKGREGVLKSQPSRAAFLQDTSHRIRFVYTPKHCSWLNQVEIWFSILSRRLLKRASFVSTDELRTRLLSFIDYFNRSLAKPFKWTFTGRALQV